MSAADLRPVGAWRAGESAPAFAASDLVAAVPRVREAAHVVRDGSDGRVGVAYAGEVVPAASANGHHPLLATLPALYPEWLGDRSFLETHGTRFPYVTGEMANGIATPALVVAVARAGMLGFFGSAGLDPDRVERGLDEIERPLAGTGLPWGSNLIHSPNQPELEEKLVEIYLRRDVRRVCASAYLDLTPSVVRFALSGLATDAAGRVRRRRLLFAKVSRPEVARRFLSPAPPEIVRHLLERGQVTPQEATLAGRVPLAGDLTVESDSGGHTDNRPLAALLPALAALRDEVAARQGYAEPVRVGAAGGLGTPAAVAAAFALGAAYVVTGTVNQASIESGLSPDAKRMLAQAGIPDVMMAPAADMFELGVRVQVLSRGTLFGVRARKLYELYAGHDSLEAIPSAVRAGLEKDVFRASLDDVWAETRRYFEAANPEELARAERDPRHRMALVFRWYLGKSSRWAIAGEPTRRLDYQIWCGPAMGAFNAWVAGTFLAEPANRGVVQIGRNLLEGAAVVTRAQQLRSYGVPVPATAFDFRPRPLQ